MLLLEKIKEKKIYIVLIILITLVTGVIYSLKFTAKEYISSATILLIKTEKISEKEVNNLGNLELSNNQISIFKEILKSDATVQEIRKNTDIQENNLSKNIKLTRNSDSLKIQVKCKDENKAIEINNKLLKIFSTKISELYDNVQIYTVDTSHIIGSTYPISILVPILISLIIGICISFGYTLILVLKEKNQKLNSNVEDIETRSLIEIPLKEENDNELISYESQKTNTSKAFKTLRTNIQFLNVNTEKKNIILVTSPLEKEGKSYISANIAISFAEVGKKVILIDSDMNTGRQSKIFNIPNNLGFSNYLSNLDSNGIEIKKNINSFINETAVKNLNLITSGTIPPNSSDLLSSDRLSNLIKDLSVFFDVVVIDGTSVLTTIDSLILSRFATSTILVSDCKKTKKVDILKSKKDIQNTGGRVIGIIVNKVKKARTKEELKNEFIEKKTKIKNNLNKIIEQVKEKREKSKQKLLTESVVKKEEPQKVIEPIINIKEEKVTIPEKSVPKNIEKIEHEPIAIKPRKEKKDLKSILPNKINENIKKEPIKEKIDEPIVKNEIKEVEKEEKNNKILDSVNEVKKYYLNFIEDIKPVVKEKFSGENNLISNLKNNLTKSIDKQEENNKIEEKVETNEKNTEKKIKTEKNQKIVKEIIDEDVKSDEAVLVIVDAERGFCRVFSKYCFAEKIINGTDKSDGLLKDQYSSKLAKKTTKRIMDLYGIDENQVKKVDPLIYTTLFDYDEYMWLERKMVSNKSEEYVFCIIKEFDKYPEETDAQYASRCKLSRKQELEKAEIDIEYKLDNMWKNMKISLVDKISIKRFSEMYEISENLKTDTEIQKSLENKEFYDDVIKKAEYKLEKIEETKTHNKLDDIIKNNDEKVQKDNKDQKKIEKRERQKERKQQNDKRREEKIKKQEELRKQKEEEKERQKEEARIEEELLVDNLYPKTKNNRNI